jgi:transposase-like protein
VYRRRSIQTAFGPRHQIPAGLKPHPHSSHLTTWRRQREQGELDGLSAKKRGPKPKEKNPLEKRLKQLEREIAQLTKRAERAEALVELQKKVSELLGVALPTPNSDESTGSSS